jgi:hypothetical protein
VAEVDTVITDRNASADLVHGLVGAGADVVVV